MIRKRKPPYERFISKILQTDTCWLWMAGIDKDGYGQLKIWDGTRFGKNVRAHRFSYEWFIGPIPEGLQIDHLCRVRKCVNPEHLEIVTLKENLKRSDNSNKGIKNRVKTHCRQGHVFSIENTYIDSKNRRNCIICQKESRKRWVMRKKLKNIDVCGVKA